MTLSEKQYYWYIRRQQTLVAYSQLMRNHFGIERDFREFKFEKPIFSNPYLFKTTSDGNYDEDEVNKKFENYAYQKLFCLGKCSSARWKQYHGRNYDWMFDQATTVILNTPKTKKHKHSTLGVASLMHLNASEVKDGWIPYYEFIECAIVDGINDAGLVCNLNVVPPGDNPNYPTLESEIEALNSGIPELKVRNVTYGTSEGKPRRFVGAICRTILDNCSTVSEVKEIINNYSWYAARNQNISFKEEFHVMVSDINSTIVIEFIENQPVIHEWSKDGIYLGCSNIDYKIGQNVLPIMTNFYISKWDGNINNLGISKDIPVNNRNSTVTEYGMGYERYQVLNSYMKNQPTEWYDDIFMEKLMNSVSYRKIYLDSPEKWTSEFLVRENNLNYRLDMLEMPEYLAFRQRAKNRVELENENDNYGIRPKVDEGLTWQTVHNSTYNIENKTLSLFSQEDYEHELIFQLI